VRLTIGSGAVREGRGEEQEAEEGDPGTLHFASNQWAALPASLMHSSFIFVKLLSPTTAVSLRFLPTCSEKGAVLFRV
jgi:hypothetical protein